MNWVRNNRFLAGYLAVMLVGVVGLGYLVYSAYSRYSTIDDQYKTQVTELKRLEALAPYPNQVNQTKYEAVRKDYAEAVRNLQTSLASYDIPPENPPPTPLQFQDRLRKAVEETVGAAQSAGVDIPQKEKFYLGFEQYSGTPPDAAATPLLATELDAINDLVAILLKNKHVDSLVSIKRGPVPGEATAATPTPALAGRPAAPVAAPLVVKYPIEIAFTALPNSFREVLNTIVSSKRLYVVRALQIKNKMDKGPARAVENPAGAPAPTAGAPAPAAPAGAPDPNAPPLPDNAPPQLRYVVGQERLDVILRIELTTVAPPPPAPAR